jgi:hypothetical protein
MPNFTVMAKDHSVGTGGVPLSTGIGVKPGQLLTISADPCDTWSARSDWPEANANGLGNPFSNSNGQFVHNGSSFVWGCLVGSLDGGRTFFGIGTRLEMTVLSTGKLSLAYWDSDSANNNGSVLVTVAVYTGPDTSMCNRKT